MIAVAGERRFVLRVRYGKAGRLRNLGHLDVMRCQERSIRRARLPFALTQGFSPHMRCAYSAALPLGAESVSEWYDLSLTDYVDPDEALARLVAQTPADVAPQAAAYVDIHSPALAAWLDRSAWSMTISAEPGADPAEAITAIQAEGQISYLRGRKERTVDLGRTLVAWSLEEVGEGRWSLDLETRSSNDGALRPDVLVAAMGRLREGDGAAFSIGDLRRLGQWHEGESGELLDGFHGVLPSNIARRADLLTETL